jgi:hypothetical protein
MTEEKIYRIVAASLIKGAQEFDPCKGCGGEDCACCEIWLERQQDQRGDAEVNMWFGDDGYGRYGRNLDEDEYDEYESDEDDEWIDMDDLDEDVDMDEYDERFVRGRYQYRLRR